MPLINIRYTNNGIKFEKYENKSYTSQVVEFYDFNAGGMSLDTSGIW